MEHRTKSDLRWVHKCSPQSNYFFCWSLGICGQASPPCTRSACPGNTPVPAGLAELCEWPTQCMPTLLPKDTAKSRHYPQADPTHFYLGLEGSSKPTGKRVHKHRGTDRWAECQDIWMKAKSSVSHSSPFFICIFRKGGLVFFPQWDFSF